jgi:outer membrane protein assembly factor BamA
MRSYKEESLIPQDLDPPCIPKPGETTEQVCLSPGGNTYLNLKLEFRFPLVPEKVEGAVFTDLGNLWQKPESFRPYQLRTALGLGVRLVTPIGPVAFDFGFNLNPDGSRHEDLFNLHFNIGVF